MTPIPDFTDAELATVRANNSAPAREVYDDLQQCVTVLLQVQADHERQLAMTGDGIAH